jgi:hypothetical protein
VWENLPMSKAASKTDEQNSVKKDSEATASTLKIPDYFKNNPFLALLNVGLIIGGILAYTFFAKIKYLPEFDLQNATTLLIGVALVGIITTIIFAICLTLPSWLIKNFWASWITLSTDDDNYSSEELKAIKSHQANSLIISSALIGVFVILEWCLFFYYFDNLNFKLFLKCAALFLIVLAIQVVRYWVIYRRFDRKEAELIIGNKSNYIKSNLVLLSAWVISSLVLILILIKPIFQFIQDKYWFGLLLNIFLLLMIIFNNSLLAAGHIFNKNKIQLLIVNIAIIFSSLIAYVGLPSSQIDYVNVPFQTFHLGDIRDSVFIVKKETCHMLNTLKPDSCLGNDNLGCVHPKIVASRIGKEYLLIFDSLDSSNSKTKEITVPLKKEDVVGWSYGNNIIPEACH